MAKQVTCRCNAYKFPHRLGGGKCGGVRVLLRIMEDRIGYYPDGDTAVEWFEGYGNAYDAATAWLAEIAEEAKEPHPASIYY